MKRFMKMRVFAQIKQFSVLHLAKHLGYGVVLFDYIDENHLALGIKCPQELSNYNSGYCF